MLYFCTCKYILMQLYELETLTINSYVMLYRMELNLLSLFLYFVFIYFTAVFHYCVMCFI